MDESVIRELEKSAKRAGMKLSAAIRIGAKLRPQCTGVHFDGRGNSCAIGAAYEGRFGRQENPPHWISWKQAFAAGIPTTDLYKKIGERNDNGWTREQIADWLESIGY